MLERNAVRSEMRQMIKAEKRRSAKEFVFTAEEYAALHQYEGGKEFSLNGDMYDVVSKEVRNGKVILTAYFDHKETSLLGKFVAMFEEDNRTTHHYQKRIHLPEFVWQESLLLSTPAVTFVSLQCSTSKPVSYITETQSPPPDFIVV